MNWVELMMANQMGQGQGLMPQGIMPPPPPTGMPMGGMGQAMSSARPPIPNMSQPMPEESPIARGLTSGMSAGRQSMEMDQEQKDRALGMVLARMFGGLASSKSPSAFGSLNEGLSGGLDEFQRERALVAEMNAREIDRQDRLAREMQRQKEREEQQRELKEYRNAALGLQREKIRGKESPELGPQSQLPNAVPLSSLPKTAASAAFKDMQARVTNGGSLKGVLSTLDEMQKLSDENPHLGDSMAVAYYASREGKGMSNVLKNITLGKDRTAVEKFGKLSSRLVQHQIKSIKGPATDRLKKIIMESTPAAGMTKDSIDYLIRTGREEALPYYKDAKEAREGLLKQVYIPAKLDEYNIPEIEQEATGNTELDPVSKFKQDFPQLADKPEAEIEEYLRSHGKI